MPAQPFKIVKFGYRCLRWPVVRLLRLPRRIASAFFGSRIWRPVRRRLIAWRHSVQQTPVILERLDTIDARYWDYVALNRRVAALEEHIEQLLRAQESQQVHDDSTSALRSVAPTTRRAAG